MHAVERFRHRTVAAVLIALIAAIVLTAAIVDAATETSTHRLGHVARTPAAKTITGARTAQTTTGAPAAVTITGARAPNVPAIQQGFIGLSIEYTTLLKYTGTDPHHVDPVFEQLIRSLSPGGAPSLRIGGVSTDHTWWPVRGIAYPAGITFTLRPAWMAVAGAFFRDLGAHTLLGVNLEAGQPAIAAAEARALTAAIGRDRVAGFEIGNEPSNYPHFAWYRVRGRAVYSRPHSYRFPDYERDFAAFAHRLQGLPIAGPALGGYGWLVYLDQFLRAAPSVSTVTFHRYPLNKCFPAPGSPEQATLHNLLTPFASSAFLAPAKPYVAIAHAHGARFRLDEFNSVSCSGKVGLSDTYASALWAVDTLFETVKDGVDGVNVHTFPDAPYAPFDVRNIHGTWSATVHPEYYGLLMFTEAAPPGATLLTVSGHTPAGVTTWATRGLDRTVRVLVVNKNANTPYRAAIRVPSSNAPALVERLLGPGLRARNGVTLGGQYIPASTLTGNLSGTRSTEVARPSGGRYIVNVPAASAALLTAAVSH
jgi:hypothetical protein